MAWCLDSVSSAVLNRLDIVAVGEKKSGHAEYISCLVVGSGVPLQSAMIILRIGEGKLDAVACGMIGMYGLALAATWLEGHSQKDGDEAWKAKS